MTKKYEFNNGKITVEFWRSYEDYGIKWNEWTVTVHDECSFGMVTPDDQDLNQEGEIRFYLNEHGYEV